MASINTSYTSQYFDIARPQNNPEAVIFKEQVNQAFQNRLIDRFSYIELIFLTNSGIYPIESLNEWLDESILKPGNYILPATQIKARIK